MKASVLSVSASNRRRGAEVFASDLDDALRVRGHTVRSVCLAAERGEPLQRTPLGPRRVGAKSFIALRRASNGVDIVLAHGSTTLPACALSLVGGATPFVYRTIGDPTFWSNTAARRLRVGWAIRRARHVVALWPAAADALTRLYGIDPDRVSVIPNGVYARLFPEVTEADREEARHELGLPRDTPVVLCLGALSPEKRVDRVIGALRLLPDAWLLVAGDGPLRPQLEAMADDAIPGRARFLGTLSEPRTALAAADVLALVSSTEGLPAVAIEAGLTGLPTVAADVGGIREIVEDGVTGVVLDEVDDASIADGLRRALASRELGRKARLHCVDRFDLERVAEQWGELLHRLTEP